jgi:hypothetical protein
LRGRAHERLIGRIRDILERSLQNLKIKPKDHAEVSRARDQAETNADRIASTLIAES